MKPVQVEAFFAHRAIEALDDSVLGRFSGLDVLDLDLFVLCPLAEGVADELWPVVASDVAGPPAHLPDLLERLGQFGGCDAVRRFYPQVFSGALVYHVDDPNGLLAGSDDPLAQKVHRPALVDLLGRQQLLERALDARLSGHPVQAHLSRQIQPICPSFAHFLAFVPQVGEYQPKSPGLMNLTDSLHQR